MKKDHATYISDTIREYIYRKYLIGQEAHGGNLEKKELLTHAIEEAADLCVYLFTKRDQENKLQGLLAGLSHDLDCIVDGRLSPTPVLMKALAKMAQKAYNTLTIGNPEGIEEEEREK